MSAPVFSARFLWLPIAGVALGDRALFVPWLHGADIACGVFLALVAWRAFAQRRRLRWTCLPPWTWALGLFVAAALGSGAVAWAAGARGFAPSEFARSAARLVFDAALALALHVTLLRAGAAYATGVVRDWFAAAAGVGLILYVLLQAGVTLPHELVCGEQRATCSSVYYGRRWFGDASPEGLRDEVFLRAQGLATEPTRFGYLLAMALGVLLLRRPVRSLPDLRHALVALGALGSFALAPYALLALLALLLIGRTMRTASSALRGRVLLGVLLLAGVVAAPPFGATFRSAVALRLHRIAEGQLDSSAFLRVTGGWAMARELVAQRPLTGAGLGHFDLGVTAVRERLPGGHLLDGSIHGWNALTYVLGTTGWLGLAAFVHLLWRALRPQPLAAPVLLLGLFADGAVLGVAFWVFLALYALPPDADGDRCAMDGSSAQRP